MRPRRLEVTAFGPFAETAVVDFDRLAEAGLFLIHGETGAGKTSLIDAVSYALYGSVPGVRTADDLRSDHVARSAVETAVTFDFSLRGDDWRVVRSPQHHRAKKRGSGLTVQKPKAVLLRRSGDAWSPVADGVEEVGRLLGELIGLTASQFHQVVVLPQGEFQQALRASPRERGELLSSLFRTERFAGYTELLAERAKALAAEVRSRVESLGDLRRLAAERWAEVVGGEVPEPEDGADMESLALASAGVLAEADDLLSRASAAADEARTAERSAQAAADRRARRARAEAELARLGAEAAAMAALGHELEEAERAEPVRAGRDGLNLAEARLTQAGEARARRQAPVTAAVEAAPAVLAPVMQAVRSWSQAAGPGVAAVAEMCDGLRSTVPRLEALAEAAARAAELEREAAEASRAAAERAEAAAAVDQETLGLETALVEARAELEAARSAEATLPARREEAERLGGQATAAAALPEMEERFADAARLAGDAEDVAVQTAQRHRALLERRIADMAGELASGLAPGEPCGVCGSREHPAPAPLPANPVTPAQLDRAEAEARFAAEQAELLGRRLGAAREEREALRLRAGAQPAEVVVQAAAAAAIHCEEAERVAAQAGQLAARVEELGAALEDRRARAGALRSEQAAAEATATRLAEEAARCESPGEDAVVALAAARALLERLDPLREAAAAEAEARSRRDEWRDELCRLAQAHGFGSVAQACEALRPAGAVQEARAALEGHRSAVAAAEAVLAEAELADLPSALDVEALAGRAAELAGVERQAMAQRERVAAAAAELARLAGRHARAEAEAGPLAAEAERVRHLADVCSGVGNEKKMSLERYVLAARLEEITAVASRRFTAMSEGRYALRHSDARVKGGGASGLSIIVHDGWTGAERDVRTLSGGETFQASLAFALAVADVVQQHAGGVHIDALFVDEGFGSLHPEALEQAMAELDRLREGGRLVGIISHVAALHERISTGVEVVKAQTGSSVRTGPPAAA